MSKEEVIVKIKEFTPELIQPNSDTYQNKKQGGSKIVVIGKPGCFAPGTEVLMFDGTSRKVENVKVGDQVMGDDSSPRNVLELCHNKEIMYNVILEDDKIVKVNKNHILSLKSGDKLVDITVKDYLEKPVEFQEKYKWYRVGVNFPEKPLEMEPYTFGVWLGNTDTNTETAMYPESILRFLDENNLQQYKYIPSQFKINSVDNRMQLLAGLIDGNGSSFDGEYIKFIVKNNEKLADDVVFLGRSLCLSVYKENINIEDGDIYSVCYIYGDNIGKIPTRFSSQGYDMTCTKSNTELSFKLEKDIEGEYFGFVLDNNHRFLLNDFSVVHNTGKCHAPGTPIIMFDGTIKPVENIKVGDKLMGDDSTPRNVLSLTSGEDTMYKVSQLKGDDYIVNEPHILSLKCSGFGKIKKGEIIDIPVNEYMSKSNVWQKKFYGYKVPIEFPEQSVEVNPYYLGYYLGSQDLIGEEYNIGDMCFELKDFLEGSNQSYVEDTNLSLYIIKNKLFGNGVHIPQNYKSNLGEIRIQLLAGIIDRNGHYDTTGRGFDITIPSKTLVDDIVFLARSLGFSASTKICSKRFGVKVRVVYKCFITGRVSDIPSHLMNIKSKDNRDVSSTSIRVSCVGKGTYYGFQLDGNHRFLLGDFTVTHNTTLIKSLLYAKKHIIPVGMAMSGTEDSNDAYKQIFPSTFVYNNYDVAKIRDFIKRQKIAKAHVANPWALLLLDDCTDDPAIFRDPLQQGLYKKGRHWKLWYILSLQYCMDVKPVIRTNVDGTFILREPNLKNRKSLWENYAGIIPDFSMFCDILDQITDDYTALYIHNATTSNKLEDCLYWYKATPIPNGFKFGCQDFWDFHEQRYNPAYKDPFISYN